MSNQMLRFLLLVALSISCLTGQSGFFVRPASPDFLSKLLRNTDAIVVAELVSATPSGTHSITTIRVARSVMGDFRPGDSITLDLDADSNPYNARFGMWLLRRTDQVWSAIPHQKSARQSLEDFSLHASADAPAQLEPDSPLPFHRAFDELLARPDAGRRDDPSDWLDLAKNFRDDPKLRAIFRQFSTSTDPKRWGLGIAGQLSMGDVDAYDSLTPERLASKAPEVLTVVDRGMCQAPPVVAFARLARLAAFPAEKFASCAALALIEHHDRASLPYLFPLLNHRSRDVRYLALYGIADVAQLNDPQNYLVWPPNPSGFEKDEEAFLKFWREWWRDTGSKEFPH